MLKSLLFIPDISGFTKFVQTTEVEHSQHVIAELLEILIASNTQKLQLAEVEGDALFFYKEQDIPSQEKLLAQVETMYTAFYGHLKLLEKNRICPCNACTMAPQLELKIVAHCGEIQSLQVQGNKKPFGESVIETHRLLKNNIDSDNYILISDELASELKMSLGYESRLFSFRESAENYDDKEIKFIYSEVDKELLKLLPYESPTYVELDKKPNLSYTIQIDASANEVLEIITNYRYRGDWVKGVDRFEYNEGEITRLGSEHVCVINGKHFNFTTVTKDVDPGKMIYGELTESIPPIDKFYQFYTLESLTENSCTVTCETYWVTRSLIKKLIIALVIKKHFKKNMKNSLDNLKAFTEK
ncbi:DUF2652 domain-containing protein [Dokdonia sp.]|uniref:DUF2652 domain-containing protein n=1 Tax=Dokdonia sp. TaxID=2024995 RepID=UPI00326789A9